MSSGMHSCRWYDTPAVDLQIAPVIAIKGARIIVGIGRTRVKAEINSTNSHSSTVSDAIFQL